tara:strand:- start:729 stop:836 length:108 start_codon:yes stop_codon:yes gene_type:complete
MLKKRVSKNGDEIAFVIFDDSRFPTNNKINIENKM